MLPHPCQPPTLGHIWASGSPSCSALGRSLPSDTITGVFHHMLLRARPTLYSRGHHAIPKTTSIPVCSWLALLDYSGAEGAAWVVIIGWTLCFWTQREETRPSPGPSMAANETLVYDCVSLHSAVWGGGVGRVGISGTSAPWACQQPLGRAGVSEATGSFSCPGTPASCQQVCHLSSGINDNNSTYRVPCKCFICSKTAVIILKRGAEVFHRRVESHMGC